MTDKNVLFLIHGREFETGFRIVCTKDFSPTLLKMYNEAKEQGKQAYSDDTYFSSGYELSEEIDVNCTQLSVPCNVDDVIYVNCQ